MRCANVKPLLFALAICLCLTSGVEAAGYQPVERPDIQRPKPVQTQKQPAQSATKKSARTAPSDGSKAGQPAKQTKIPSFKQPDSSKPREIEQPQDLKQESEATPEKPPTTSKSQNLFGTVEFKRPLESLPGWLDVLSRNKQQPIFFPEKFFDKQTTWGALRAKAEPLGEMDQLRLVNKFWNNWPYREDNINWGKADYWAIPAQFILKSGDCEDYAIAKYFTLKELGLDPASMRIVVLRDTVRNLAHAVLAVYLNGDIFILDNLSNVVLSHKRMRNYSPQFSINEFGRWTHIKGKPASK